MERINSSGSKISVQGAYLRMCPLFAMLLTALLLSSCTGMRGIRPLLAKGDASSSEKHAGEKPQDLSLESISVVTARHADGNNAGARVLASALEMLEKKTIVVGSCWDYINRVYTNAGYTQDKRAMIYSSKETGPYIDPLLIKPGDWVMFKNLTFGNIGHSAIFVAWLDLEKRSAITIEYAGQNRKEPGRYREYDITKCYGALRGRE